MRAVAVATQAALDAGSIIERERHEALVAHGGLYRQLYDRRFVDVATDNHE